MQDGTRLGTLLKTR